MSYAGKDGLIRDYKKLRALGVPWRMAMRPHWERFTRANGLKRFHAFTNLLTEGGRASPYYFGHVVVWPLVATVVIETGYIVVHAIGH